MTCILLHILFFFSTRSDLHNAVQASDKLQVVDYNGLEQYLEQYQDRTLLLNFWASWCVPCVKELPYFEQVTQSYPEDEVMVVLVSLDFTKQLDSVLKPFLKKNNVRSKVIVLDDPDQTTWIDKVDPSWSGAIPVTLFRRGDKKVFYEKPFHSFEELNSAIQSF